MIEEEQAFWTELRFSISECEVLDSYCDWIEPKSYYLSSPSTTIEGKVGCLTPEMKIFKFKLIVPRKIDELTESEWRNLTRLEIDTNKIILTKDTVEFYLIEE